MNARTLLFLTGWLIATHALAAPSGAVAERVLSRTPNTKTVEYTHWVVSPLGQPTVKSSYYVVLGSGLHRRDSTGQLVESQPVLLVQTNGTILGTGGAYELTLSSDLATSGAVEILTSDQKKWKANLLYLAWYDPDVGKSKTLAIVTNSTAELWPDQRLVIYRNAFNGVLADVIYEYQRGRFSQSVLLREQLPVPPAEFGPRTRLEAVSEVIEVPSLTKTVGILRAESDPVRRARVIEPDFIDERLNLGEMMMPTGRSFWVQDGERSVRKIAVGKRLMAIGQRSVLIEAVELAALSVDLQRLPPRTASTSRMPSGIQEGHGLPAPLLARNSAPERPIVRLAKAETSAKGLLLDYELISYEENFTFSSGTTYLIDNWADIFTATFERGAIIKFPRFAGLGVYLSASSSGSSGKTIFTSSDDDSIGDTISGSTGQPVSYYANPSLRLDTLDANVALSNFEIRHAWTGIEDAGGSTSDTLSSSYIWHSQLGATTSGSASLTLSAIDFCNVSTNYSGNVSGSSLTTCTDSDSDGMPDSWELAWFGSLSQTASGDYDGDGVSNLAEYQQGLNPKIQDTNHDGVMDQPFKGAQRRPSVSSIIP